MLAGQTQGLVLTKTPQQLVQQLKSAIKCTQYYRYIIKSKFKKVSRYLPTKA